MRFQSFQELIDNIQAQQAVKRSFDGGKTWKYVKVRSRFPEKFLDYTAGTKVGIVADAEVTPTGLHSREPIMEESFALPEFIIETTTDEEVQGKEFSYDSLYESMEG